MIRRTEITIETHRRLVIRRLHGARRGWCEGCFDEVEMITPNEAATAADVSSRTIYRWIEAGKIHFSEQFGALLICGRSLESNVANGRRALATQPALPHQKN